MEEAARIRALISEVRQIRDRTCEPKNRSNVRYHALSQAVQVLVVQR